MRVFIGILTCPKHADRDEAISKTWMPAVWHRNLNVTVKFVFAARDEAYHYLGRKMHALTRYVYDAGFDTLITVDNDTFFVPLPEYIAEFTEHECLGHIRDLDTPYAKRNAAPYPHGSCFGLSRLAMQAVLAAPQEFDLGVHDTAVGRALHKAGIALTHTDRIKTCEALGVPRDDNDIISTHYVTPARMYELMRLNARL